VNSQPLRLARSGEPFTLLRRDAIGQGVVMNGDVLSHFGPEIRAGARTGRDGFISSEVLPRVEALERQIIPRSTLEMLQHDVSDRDFRGGIGGERLLELVPMPGSRLKDRDDIDRIRRVATRPSR